MQQAAIEAVRLQRSALMRVRWAYLDESGAFEFRDAAAELRMAAQLLVLVSDAVLRESGRYRLIATERKLA